MSNNRDHADDARPIRVGNYGVPARTQLPLTWTEAARLFFRDNKMSVLRKFGARYLPALLAFVGVADDSTVIGIADEPLTIAFVGWCIWRINKYRKTGK